MADEVCVKAKMDKTLNTEVKTNLELKTVKSLPSDRPRDDTNDSVARRWSP